jgi:hypothetical protein
MAETQAATHTEIAPSACGAIVTPNSLILLFIILVLVGVALGRHFQRAIDAWRSWKDTVARIPILEAGAKTKARLMVKLSLGALLLLALLANHARFYP